MARLSHFNVSPDGDEFRLRFEDDAGQTFDALATPDQLDAIVDAADALLDEDDAAFEAEEDDGQIYQKPLG